MTKFELKILECLPPKDRKEDFYKLIGNGKCWYDEFYKKIKKSGSHNKSLKKLESIIALLAQGHRHPKLKKLKGRGNKDPYIDYEIKVNRLRIYLFEENNTGKIIVLGELKKDKKKQRKNIDYMRAIKLEYFKAQEEKEEKIKIDIENSSLPHPSNKHEPFLVQKSSNIQEEE